VVVPAPWYGFSHNLLKPWLVIHQTSRTEVKNMVINLLLECVIVTVNDVVSPSELHGIAMSKQTGACVAIGKQSTKCARAEILRDTASCLNHNCLEAFANRSCCR